MSEAHAATAVHVSVVISTLDRPLQLARCLDALLTGTGLPREVVVVDQGDASLTRQVLEERDSRGVPLLHVVQTRRGLSASQNAGVEHSRGPVSAIVDDDCVPDARWVEVVAREHSTASRPLLLTGRVLPLAPVGDRVLPLSSRTSTVRALLPDHTPPWAVGTGGNFAVSRAAFLAVGGNDERLGTGGPGRAGNDLDLFRRLMRAGVEARYEPDLLVHHERATAAERRSRRWTYGFGAGACVALWQAEADPAAGRILREWLSLRLSLLRRARRPGAIADELRVLLGTAHGWRYGRSAAGREARTSEV